MQEVHSFLYKSSAYRILIVKQMLRTIAMDKYLENRTLWLKQYLLFLWRKTKKNNMKLRKIAKKWWSLDYNDS